MEAIIIEDLVKRYGPTLAVDHANLRVEEGTVFGLIGPNGAGKSTIIRSLLGITPARGREGHGVGGGHAAATPTGR